MHSLWLVWLTPASVLEDEGDEAGSDDEEVEMGAATLVVKCPITMNIMWEPMTKCVFLPLHRSSKLSSTHCTSNLVKQNLPSLLQQGRPQRLPSARPRRVSCVWMPQPHSMEQLRP